MAGGEAFLKLDGLGASYGGTQAVADVSLDLARGELVALLGPSGCGKTTTLRMVAGFVAPSRGRILLEGRDITRLPAHARGMGVVFQSYALFQHLSVLDNVAFGLRMRGLSAAARRAKAGAALEAVALSGLADRYPHQLSGGQQQRVALARALAVEPSVLLLDEPLSNLDAHLRADMRGEIRRLQTRLGITTLFVTHDQEEALAIADRVGVMDAGRLVEVADPVTLCDRPAHAFTAAFLGARTLIPGATRANVFHAAGLTCTGAPEGATALVLRAARLRLATAPTGPLTATGTLAGLAYLGDSYELDVETAAGRVRVLSPSDITPPSLGHPCAIEALAGACSFLTSLGASR